MCDHQSIAVYIMYYYGISLYTDLSDLLTHHTHTHTFHFDKPLLFTSRLLVPAALKFIG